ncbi:hypothetical protein BJX63DRAFT_1420 [Aspergillus granulosus]|uniref:GPI anchored serine-threonine rich protein n=1 Tax=Aspergillus granulosus TaxID=176169 RepID=A0ABR4I6M5_9EURO
MYTSALLFASLLAAPALASPDQKLAVFGLSKRQGGESFQPDTIPSDCTGLPICGSSGICYDTSLGESCCPDGTWACPGGSFCLQDGYCCPDGLDPESCAAELGITLTSSEPEPTTTTTSSSSTPVIPTYTETTTTPPPSSSSAIPPTDTDVPPEFTGAANTHAFGGAAAVLGGLGVIGNLLI